MPRSEATAAYLRRLALDPEAELPATYDTLLALHRAHLAAVPDDTRLSLSDLDDTEPRGLYDDQWARHEAWTAAGRP